MDSRQPKADLVDWAEKLQAQFRSRFPKIARFFEEVEEEDAQARARWRKRVTKWVETLERAARLRGMPWIATIATIVSFGFLGWFAVVGADITRSAIPGAAAIAPLSMQFATDATTIRYILATWGDAGRELFRHSVHVDFAFIPCYVVMLTAWLLIASRRNTHAFVDCFALGLAAAFPLAALSDVAENLLLLSSLNAFPAASSVRGFATATFAFLKWSWFLASVTTLSVLVIGSLWKAMLPKHAFLRALEDRYLRASPVVHNLVAVVLALPFGLMFYSQLTLPLPGDGVGRALCLLVGCVLPLGLFGQPRVDFRTREKEATEEKPPAVDEKDDQGAKPTGGSVPSRPRILPMLMVPSGMFTLGSPGNEKGRFPDEGPIENVRVGPFEIGKTVVTREQWRTVMGAKNARPEWKQDAEDPDEGHLPANYVSWFDAIQFCNRASELEGRTRAYEIERNAEGAITSVRWSREADGYRLPIEAEWEFAARAGTTSAYPWPVANDSDEEIAKQLNEHAWWWRNSGRQVHPVATKPPNQFELYDMIGNVQEWCYDAIDGLANPNGADGDTLRSGRVVRGGSFLFDDPRVLRSAFRGRDPPGLRVSYQGFRCVAAPLRQHGLPS